ncbi:hypothetical protein D3C72_585310 [compost metagenome]
MCTLDITQTKLRVEEQVLLIGRHSRIFAEAIDRVLHRSQLQVCVSVQMSGQLLLQLAIDISICFMGRKVIPAVIGRHTTFLCPGYKTIVFGIVL